MRIEIDGKVVDYKPFVSLEEAERFQVTLKEFCEKYNEVLDITLLDALVAGVMILQAIAVDHGVGSKSDEDGDYFLSCAKLGYLAAKYPEELIGRRRETSDLMGLIRQRGDFTSAKRGGDSSGGVLEQVVGDV